MSSMPFLSSMRITFTRLFLLSPRRTEGRENVETGFIPLLSSVCILAFFCSYSFSTGIPLAHKAVCSPVSNYLQIQYHHFICFSDISSLPFILLSTAPSRTGLLHFSSSLLYKTLIIILIVVIFLISLAQRLRFIYLCPINNK